MKSLTAGKNDAGQRLDKFLRRAVPGLPQSLMYKYIRTKRVKLNHGRAAVDARLAEGDLVELYIRDEFFTEEQKPLGFLCASGRLNVLYEDENLLLLDKQPGLLCHPDEREYADTLIGRVQRYLYEKGEYVPEAENAFAPALANRIDRNTGGIVLAAKNAPALRALNQKLKERGLRRFYLCVLHGVPKPAQGLLKDYLIKDEAKNTVRIYKYPAAGAKEIRTAYRVLDSRDGLSLVEAELLTGRTHQIRAQLAFHGHPLLGDGKYGSNRLNRQYGGYKRQFLYACRLDFAFTDGAGLFSYLAGRSFRVKNVWFKEAFYKGELHAL